MFPLLLLAIVVSSFANAEIEERIIGVETDIEEVPYVVSVQGRCLNAHAKCSHWRHICTGILVSDKHVMMAASCCYGKEPNSTNKVRRSPMNMLVMVGSDRKDLGRRMAVSDCCHHPSYNGNTLANEAGMIYLEKGVKFGKRVQVAKVPSGKLRDTFHALEQKVLAKERCRVYGWNMSHEVDDEDEEGLKEMLMMIQIKLVDIQKCNSSFDHFQLNQSQHVCAGFRSRDLCDLGSPLVCSNVVWGMYLSTGYCVGNQPSVFSRMDVAMAWRKYVLHHGSVSLLSSTFQLIISSLLLNVYMPYIFQ